MRRFLKFVALTTFIFFVSLSSFANNAQDMMSINMPQYFYSIQYPANWTYKDYGKGLVVFNGKSKDNQQKVMVNIQTIATTKEGGHYPDVKALMNDFWSEAPKHVNHAKFLIRKKFTLTNEHGSTLNGEETVLTFYESKQLIKHWQIMLLSDDGNLFQTFAYRTTDKEFDLNIDTAKKMLASWQIQNNRK